MEPEGWQRCRLEGVWRRRVQPIADERGSFTELWRWSWTREFTARQVNLSRSRPGSLRGMHCHRRQADLWVVLEGHPFVALVDLRPALAGTGPPVSETLEGEPGDALVIPAGVAHGFQAADPISLLYMVSHEYDGSDELGFAWDDPIAALPWPDRRPLLSARDAAAPSLAQLIERLRQVGHSG